MNAPDPILGLMDRFTAAINAHDLDVVGHQRQDGIEGRLRVRR